MDVKSHVLNMHLTQTRNKAQLSEHLSEQCTFEILARCCFFMWETAKNMHVTVRYEGQDKAPETQIIINSCPRSFASEKLKIALEILADIISVKYF